MATSPKGETSVVTTDDRGLPVFDTHVLERVLRMESEAHDPVLITGEQIEADVLAYRRFLRDRKLAPGVHVVPLVQVDRVWHIHILQTEHYREVCESYLGRFLHHASLICGAGGERIKPWHTRE
ncbi:MAG TPA: hypothetical protein VJI73_03585 [Candidatus Paceibacterota bacterium]